MTTRNLKPYPIYTTVLTGANLPVNVGYRPRIPQTVFDILRKESTKERLDDATKHKIIQTMFRESEAQTDPYEVDVAEVTDKGLEILSLGWLSWNNGLPAGIHEITTIERARQRRAWEAALPIPFDETSKYFRRIIIEAMEMNEWNYREETLAAIASLRMELAEKAMKERCLEGRMKYEQRLAKYIQAKREEKNKKIQKLRMNTNREIRKLTLARQKVNRKYHRWNIIKLFADKTSDLYAPIMRFGKDPRNRHEKIPAAFESSAVFRHLEMIRFTTADIPPVLKPAFDCEKNSKRKDYSKELCIRWTKWTEENLEKLHEELKQIRRKRYIPQRPCHLKQKVVQQMAESQIPCVVGISDDEEEKFQCCLFLQKTIKGRAIQAAMFEGRVKCQELIEELKSTHALQNNMEDVKAHLRRRVYGLQRQAEIEQIQERRKNEILCALEGKTTGDMLDFLSKELLRLQDERKTHAMALAANLERHKREAAEAGRRQVEEQRRREHDEMFKQILKMHQNTVQAFLEEVMIENRAWLANRTAREEITEIAKKIDIAASETAMSRLHSLNSLQEEEIIADLIHNFALPEAEKRLVRDRMKKKQQNYLRVCHDEVYSNIEKVVMGPRNQDGDLLPVPMKGKHNIPSLIRVKYLHLKRMGSNSSSMDTLSSGDSILDETFDNTMQDTANEPEPQQSDHGNWSSGFSVEQVILKNDSEKNDQV